MTKQDLLEIIKEELQIILLEKKKKRKKRKGGKRDGKGASSKGYSLRDWFKGGCLLYTSPSPRDMRRSRMPSSA